MKRVRLCLFLFMLKKILVFETESFDDKKQCPKVVAEILSFMTKREPKIFGHSEWESRPQFPFSLLFIFTPKDTTLCSSSQSLITRQYLGRRGN